MSANAGAPPDRVDAAAVPGDPFRVMLTAFLGGGTAQDFTGWSGTAVVRERIDGPILHTLVMTGQTDGLVLSATPAETAGWRGWPVDCARLEVSAADPSGEPILRAAGWLTVYH